MYHTNVQRLRQCVRSKLSVRCFRTALEQQVRGHTVGKHDAAYATAVLTFCERSFEKFT
jgi:hypothetical protein